VQQSDGHRAWHPMALAWQWQHLGLVMLTIRDLRRVAKLKANLALYRFEDKPKLLASVANPGEGMTWEVAPAYRRALNLSNSSRSDVDAPF
jgi:hypothetical protein